MRAVAAGMTAAVLAAGACLGGGFSPGTLVVYRVGDGTTNLVGSGSPGFLDEYTTNGTLVQSVAMPTNAAGRHYPLIASGTATSEGLLTRSVDNRCLVVTGYGTTMGGASLSGTTATSVPRVVGVVNCDGTTDTTTALKDFASASNPRSAATTDGTNIWVAGGAGGPRYTTKGATNSTSLNSTFANLRQIAAFGGQLYASSQSGSNRLNTVGAGMPTNAGQAIVALQGLPTNSSPDAFFMADLTADGTNDTLYVADESAGLQKFALVGGTWMAVGVAGSGADSYRGLTGYAAGSAVVLFATRNGGGANGGGELVTITDNTGYNGIFGGTPTVLATATAKTAFRGVALAPFALSPAAPPASHNRMVLSIH